MYLNRVLRSVQRTHELVIYEFLTRLYDSELSQKRLLCIWGRLAERKWWIAKGRDHPAAGSVAERTATHWNEHTCIP